MQHQSHFALGWCSWGLQVPLRNNFSLCHYFCFLQMSSWHIPHDYYAKYLLKLQSSLLFLLKHVQHASRHKATPLFNKSLVGKKIMQASDKKGRLLKHTWCSRSSCLPETQSCFQSLLELHFLLQDFEAKTLDSRPQVLSPKVFRREGEKGWYLMGRWPPKEMTEFYSICEKYHTVITVLPQKLLLWAWNWWVMVREYFFASTNMKITPFHLSLEQPSGKQEGERKSLLQFGPEINGNSLMIKTTLIELVTGTT